MNCPVCGGLAAAGATRCAQCGAHLAVAERRGFAYTSDTYGEPREQLPDNPVDWYKRVFTKYAEFDGRATRSEYWWFLLMNIVASCIVAFIGFAAGVMGLYFLYMLAVMIPGFAVAIRRLHDTGRSGWWWLINFVPLIGGIVFIIFTVQDSQPGRNAYGPNPKGVHG